MFGKSFVCRKFNAMLGVATMTMSVNFIVMLSGSVIVGNMVGPDALAGVNVCAPAFGVAAFVSSLLSVGSGLVFSQAMGAFDERRAAGVFSQSAGLALLCGVVTCLAMTLMGSAFFDFMGVTGAVRQQAESYWRWQALAMGLNPMVMLMEAMVMADGDAPLAAAAGACHAAGSIGVSVLLTHPKFMGTAGGASAGTAIAMLLVLAVTSLHFLRRNNHLKFIRYRSRRDLKETVAGSLPDASIYLCWAILIMVVNKIVIGHHGESMLAVVALATSVVQFSIVFDGVGEALIPIGGMYEGEGNWPALRKLADHSALMATAEGLVCGVVFWILAPVLAPLFGIRGAAADLLPEAIHTMRILAFAMPFMGFLMMANTHYLIVHHAKLAVSVTIIKDFVLPCLFALLFGRTHFAGLWYGFLVGYVLAAAYPFVFVLVRHGRKLFPWLVPDARDKIMDFSLQLSKASVVDVRDRIGSFLRGHGIEERVVSRAMLTVEETALATLDQNKGASPTAEYAVFLNRKGFVRLVTRDTGRAFDVNTVTKFLSAIAERRYLNTLDCNRSEYYFKLGE